MSAKSKEQLEKELAEALAKITALEAQVKDLEDLRVKIQAELDKEKQHNKGITDEAFKVLQLSQDQAAKIKVLEGTVADLRAAHGAAPAAPLPAAVREKMMAGLSEKQAREVIASQQAEDAARAAKAEDSPED